MPQIRTNGITTHYQITGSGPALVLVSGLGGTAGYWAPQIEALSRQFTVLSYDQRGAGQTEAPDMEYSIAMLAEDLAGLITATGLDRPAFIGHSTGGAIGQVLAATRPDLLSGMVQYATWPQSDAHFNWCFRMRKALLAGTSTEEYLLGSALFLYPPAFVAEHADRLETAIRASAAAFPPPEIVIRRIDAIMAHDARAQLGAITCPTLVLTAADDVLTPPYHARALAAAIPGARLELVDHGGHSLSETRPDLFNALVLDFLAGLDAAPRAPEAAAR